MKTPAERFDTPTIMGLLLIAVICWLIIRELIYRFMEYQ